MNNLKAFPLRVHENAILSCNDFDDRLELNLVNKYTGKTSNKSYFKLDKGIDVNEAIKIDAIIYHMHNEIGLNLWDSMKEYLLEEEK